MIKTRNYVAKDTSIFCAVLLVSDSDVNNENESYLSTLQPPPLSSPVFKYRNLINFLYICMFFHKRINILNNNKP